MSKKKISQIVGLTIGAAAIAATGIGSSIALTSCTSGASDNQTNDTPITLNSDALNTVFSTITSQIENKGYVPETDGEPSPTEGELNSTVFVQVLKSAIKSELSSTNNINLPDNAIDSISFTLTQINPDNGRVITGATVSANVQFDPSITIDAGDSGYTVDTENNTVSNSDLTTLSNKMIVNLDSTKSPDIQSAVETVLNGFWSNGKGDNANETALNTTSYVQDAFIGQIVKNVNSTDALSRDANTLLSNENIKNIDFVVNPTTSDSPEQDISYTINFNENVDLSSWTDDNSYFTVDVDGPSIQSKQNLVVANPNHEITTVQAGNSQGIMDAVQGEVAKLSGDQLQTSYLNSNAFQNTVKNAISNVTGCASDNFSIHFDSVTGTATNNEFANIKFTINFGANVDLTGDWNNGIFKLSGNTISSVNGVQIKNPNFKKVSIDANNTSTINDQIVNAFKSQIESDSNWSVASLNNNQAFIDNIKTIIKSNAGNDNFKSEYITSVVFTDSQDSNSRYANINYTISFDKNYVAFDNSWSSSVFNLADNTLSTKSSFSVANPNFQPVDIDASEGSQIYNQVVTLVQNTNSKDFSADVLNNNGFSQQVIAKINKIVNAQLQLGTDIQSIFFNVVGDNNSQNLTVSFNITFGANVTLTGFSSSAGQDFTINGKTLHSKSFTIVNNNYHAPQHPTINQGVFDTINQIIKQGLTSAAQDGLVNSNLGTNDLVKNGILGDLNTQLSAKVKNFKAGDITSLSFAVTGPSTVDNIIHVQPSISFASEVLFDGVSADTTLNEFSINATNPFIDNNTLNVIQTAIQNKLTNLEATNPNSITNETLNNTGFVGSIINTILGDSSITNANLKANNLAIHFEATPSQDRCSVSVGYTISFKGSDLVFADGLSADGLTVDAAQKTATCAPVNYANYVLSGSMVGQVYQTIGAKLNEIKTNIVNVNKEYLNKQASGIINTINNQFSPKDGQSVIDGITFSVSIPTNKVTATVTFNDKFVISGAIKSDNISTTTVTNQYEMSFNVDGLSAHQDSIVTSDDVNILDSTVTSFINNQSLQNIDQKWFDSHEDDLITLLKGKGFNTDWLNRNSMSFTVTNGGEVVFSVQFNGGLTLPSSIHNSTFTKTVNVTGVQTYLSQARFATLADNAKTTIVNKYNELAKKDGNNWIQLNKDFNSSSASLTQSITNSLSGSGFDTNKITASSLNASLTDSDHEIITYSFTVDGNVTLQDDVTKATGFTQSSDKSGNYIFTKVYDTTDGIKGNFTRTAITADTLSKITQAVHAVIDPAYQASVNGQGSISYANCISGKKDALINKIAEVSNIDKSLISSLDFSSNDQITDGNMGNVSFTINFNPTTTKLVNISNTNQYTVSPNSNYNSVSTSTPIMCGSDLYTFSGNTITGLTPKGMEASQLRLNAYHITNINAGAFMNANASVMDFTNCSFPSNKFPAIMEPESKYSATAHNTNLTTVILPTNITSLANNAFASCPNLSNIQNLFNSSKITGWSSGMLRNCPKITNITIPEEAAWNIQQNAFTDCTGIQTLNISAMSCGGNYNTKVVADIINQSITRYNNPTTIYWPKNLWMQNKENGDMKPLHDVLVKCSIPFELYTGTANSDTIVDTSWQDIPVKIFHVMNPRFIGTDGSIYRGIGPNAFQGNKYLEKIEVLYNSDANTFSNIQPYAFYGCSNLKECNLLDDSNSTLQTIMDYAFYGCQSLQNVTFPNSLRYIYQRAFENASIRVKAGSRLKFAAWCEYKNGATTWHGTLGFNAFRNSMIYNADGSVIQYNVISPENMCSGVGKMHTSGGLGNGWGQNMDDCYNSPNKGVQIWGNTTALFGILNDPAYNNANNATWNPSEFFYSLVVHRFDISGKCTDDLYKNNWYPATRQ